jgi:hypothetical protein
LICKHLSWPTPNVWFGLPLEISVGLYLALNTARYFSSEASKEVQAPRNSYSYPGPLPNTLSMAMNRKGFRRTKGWCQAAWIWMCILAQLFPSGTTLAPL